MAFLPDLQHALRWEEAPPLRASMHCLWSGTPFENRFRRKQAREHPGIVVGAGTVLDPDTANRCLAAGAMFLTSPGLVPEVVEFAIGANVVVMPGALTPTEVLLALRCGANYVKIFPCAQFGGPGYVRALKAPFPDAKLITSGGVTQQNATDFLLAGASALGVGEDLIPREAVRNRNATWIRELARRFNVMVKQTRDAETARLFKG